MLALSPLEGQLALYAWMRVNPVELPTVTHDTNANTLTAEVGTTGTSSMLAARAQRVYLPLVLR